MFGSLLSDVWDRSFFSSPFGIVAIVFQVWMLIDAIRRQEWIWVIFIFFFPFFSALWYFFAVFRHGVSVTRGFELPGAGARHRIKELEAQIHHLDKAHHHFQLADIYFRKGKLDLAEKHYQASLDREPQDIDARAHLGQTLLRKNKPDEARPLLEGVCAENPKHDYGHSLMAYAETLAAQGDTAGAMAVWKRVLDWHTYPRARVQLAELYAAANQAEDARRELNETISEDMHAPAFDRKRNRFWIKRARSLLRKLPRGVVNALLLAGIFAWPITSTAGSTVTVDSNLVLVINDKKVFPIGFSPGPPTRGRTPRGDDALKELRSSGAHLIRMAMTTAWNAQVISNQQAELDWAQEHGMFCWVNLRELSRFAADDSSTEAKLRKTVNLFKNHPALGLWKNQDEAWWGRVSAADLGRGYKVIKQEDPHHPVVQTHAPRGTIKQLQPYNAAADILALDIYPVGIPPGAHSLLPNKEISMVGDWTKTLFEIGEGRKQIWMIEQIGWSGVLPPRKKLVFPTFKESRYMAYQAIINGARGLMFFGGNITLTLNATDAPLGWNWTFWNQVLKRVVEELGDHSPLASALVTTNSTLPITLTGAASPDLEFCVREVPSHLYILAAKREGKETTVSFNGLPSWASTAEVLYESGRKITLRNGQFSDKFEPFDVHVYRLTRKSAD